MEAVTATRTIQLQASPQQLWPFISDTDRVNRLLRLPTAQQVGPTTDMRRMVANRRFGLPLTWHEHPFEWVFEQWFRSVRSFDAPLPMRELIIENTLTAQPNGGTAIDVRATVVPRNMLGRTLVPFGVAQTFLRQIGSIYQSFDAMALTVESSQHLLRTPTSEERLTQMLGNLSPDLLSNPIVTLLADHLLTANDSEVVQMRPFALADRWRTDRVRTLEVFLEATVSGILDLEWSVMCPSCRGPSIRARALAALVSEAHCPSCNIRYDVNFDEAVEVRFRVNGSIRNAQDEAFCIGGPANTPHIVSQLWVGAGKTRSVDLRLDAGGYRVRSRFSLGSAPLDAVPAGGTETTTIRISEDVIETGQREIACGMATLALTNTTATPILVALEQRAWSAQAASAAFVTSLTQFRTLFASDVLAPGLTPAIRRLTFLFSDLRGSTRMYDQIGDAHAYARIRDHFVVMERAIADNNGALIKTIGDAVMAVFPSPRDGVRAAFAIQQAFVRGEGKELQVKLGLHTGPCIAVNANGVLDYFGSTVNIAARVQNESKGGDIVISRDVLDDEDVWRLLTEERPVMEDFSQTLRGIREQVQLYRLWPHRDVSAPAPALAEA